jgi:hypothetical protein
LARPMVHGGDGFSGHGFLIPNVATGLCLLGRWIGGPCAASLIGAGRTDLLLRSSRSLAIRLWPFLVFLPGQLSALRRPFPGPISHDQTKAYECNPKGQAQLGVESIVVIIRPWSRRSVTEIEQIIRGKKWTNNKAYQIRKHAKRCLHAFSSFVRSWYIYARSYFRILQLCFPSLRRWQRTLRFSLVIIKMLQQA